MTRSGWREWIPTVAVVAACTAPLLAHAWRPAVLPALPDAAGSCDPAARFAPVYTSMEGALLPAGTGWQMKARSGVSARLCTPGVLDLQLDGHSARGAPRLTALLDQEVLGEWPVDGKRSLQVPVPRPGTLTLLYLNFYYDAEVRLVEVSGLRMNNDACRFLSDVQVTPGTPDGWSPPAGILTLSSGAPATVTPCQPGKLTFTARGQAAAGLPPKLVVMQGEDVLHDGAVPTATEAVTLSVSGAALSFRLGNPYARLLGHRSLDLESLRWTPRAE